MEPYVIKLDELGMNDVEIVGGKNASLGEMISNLSNLGVSVPGGFATTAEAYRAFLGTDGLDARITAVLDSLDVDDIGALKEAGRSIRAWILDTPLPGRLRDEIETAWAEMSDGQDIAVAVRSSATAEDLPDASFAGQQETFLNVVGIARVAMLAGREALIETGNSRDARIPSGQNIHPNGDSLSRHNFGKARNRGAG